MSDGSAADTSKFIEAGDARPPSPTERDPPLAPDGDDRRWRENLDAGRDEAPTSAREDEGWRGLKPF